MRYLKGILLDEDEKLDLVGTPHNVVIWKSVLHQGKQIRGEKSGEEFLVRAYRLREFVPIFFVNESYHSSWILQQAEWSRK